MITRISVRDFRSIENADIDLAPITVFYGPTSSGKSSLLYAALVLRNFVLNPNRPADGFFDLGFMNLGGLDECSFNHDAKRAVKVAVSSDDADGSRRYEIAISKSSAKLRLEAGEFVMEGTVSVPYGQGSVFPFTHRMGGEEYKVSWNGIACTVTPQKPTPETQEAAVRIAGRFNSVAEVLRTVDIAPHRRGFYKPSYAPIAVSATPTSEDEVASMIINDPHMAGRISTYTEQVFGRDFRTYTLPGTGTVYLQAMDKQSRTPVYLVNEGFGINQVVYLLAKMYRPDTQTLFIEEPEVHLHPTIVRNLARAICTFAVEEGKQLVMTTHSEQLLSALLIAVQERLAPVQSLRCYLVTKEKRATQFRAQAVAENGQIEGGLTAFIEAETEDLRRFLGIGR
jgi:predicted ATPase